MEKEVKHEKKEVLRGTFTFTLRARTARHLFTVTSVATPSDTCHVLPNERDDDLQACTHAVGWWFSSDQLPDYKVDALNADGAALRPSPLPVPAKIFCICYFLLIS